MARDWEGLDGRDVVKEVTCAEPYHWVDDEGSRWVMQKAEGRRQNSSFPIQHSAFHIVAYDFGIKENILRHLSSYGANVTVVPADTTADEVLALQPDGIFLSNGPGDPAGLPYAVKAVSELIESDIPIFGICLGHQLIGRALGAYTHKLKFGHHGANHPVQHLPSGKVLISAQNHNYCVSEGELNKDEVEITYKSLNDDFNQKQIPVGKTFVYEFVARRPGTFMYHPHADEMTQMAMGMMGFWVTHPKSKHPLIEEVDRDFCFLLYAYDIDPGSYTPQVNTMLEFNLWTWNCRAFPGIDSLNVRKDDKVRIRMGNLTMTNHPMHLHGHEFVVSGTDGGPTPIASRWPEVTTDVAVGQMRQIEFLADQEAIGLSIATRAITR